MRALDLLSLEDDLLVVNDFNLRLQDLSLDVQVLEESRLLRVETSGASFDPHINGSYSTDFSGCLSAFTVDELLDLGEISVCEDDAGVASQQLHDLLELVAILPGVFTLFVVCVTLLRFRHLFVETGTHKSVLAHDDLRILLSEHVSELVDLLAADVVGINEQCLLVLLGQTLQFLPVSFLLYPLRVLLCRH